MSEYWKSTPKYWCKYCAVFVRDTKLERANHESTARHQNAIQRSLRELHRGHEREERDKDRAKRELERLDGVVSGRSASSASALTRSAERLGAQTSAASRSQASADERQRQLEQLAHLGVAIPDDLRGSMAMAGEWTVTSTRVVDDGEAHGAGGSDGSAAAEPLAKGVRKREHEVTEEEQEEERAVNNLFKKAKQWGRDSKTVSAEEDLELEALLSVGLAKKAAKKENDVEAIKEEDAKDEAGPQSIEADPPEKTLVKLEPDESESKTPILETDGKKPTSVQGTEVAAEAAAIPGGVVFKKRKAKDIRHR